MTVSPNQTKILSCLNEYLLGMSGPFAARAVLNHPMMQILKRSLIGHEQALVFCEMRYSAASNFEKILERGVELARLAKKEKLAEELQMNLDDERGEGRAEGKGAHNAWRGDFAQGARFELKIDKDTPPIYAFDKEDNLPTLVGVLLAAERAIPPEDERILHTLRQTMPGVVTDENDHGDAEQKKTTLYLRDHIAHDAEHHFPEMLKAVLDSFTEETEIEDIIKGMKRFCAERTALYDYIQQSLGLNFPRLKTQTNETQIG